MISFAKILDLVQIETIRYIIEAKFTAIINPVHIAA